MLRMEHQGNFDRRFHSFCRLLIGIFWRKSLKFKGSIQTLIEMNRTVKLTVFNQRHDIWSRTRIAEMSQQKEQDLTSKIYQ